MAGTSTRRYRWVCAVCESTGRSKTWRRRATDFMTHFEIHMEIQ